MRIGLIGGVFAKPAEMQRMMDSAPENVLAAGLERQGIIVRKIPLDVAPSHVDVDLYHCHHFGRAAFSLALEGTRPYVFTSHNPFVASRYPERLRPLEWWLRWLVFRHAVAVVALSHTEARVFVEDFGVDPGKITVIGNALPDAFFETLDPAGGRDQHTILTVGQLESFKGLPTLLKAIAALTADCPLLQLRVISQNRHRESEYRALAQHLGIADRVRFDGPCDSDELRRAYRTCTLFVLPSYAESYSVVTMEALACGAPVLVTGVGGARELVGEAAVVVAPGSVQELSVTLVRLLSDAAERERLGLAGAVRARSVFRSGPVVAAHVRLYTACVHKRPVRYAWPLIAMAWQLWKARLARQGARS